MSNSVRLEKNNSELKILIFRLGTTLFGINVSRVREVIERTKTIKIPYTLGAVEGIFKLRDEIMTLVALGKYFNMSGKETQDGEGAIIVVEFNETRYGILVDTVEVIHALTWGDIEPPAEFLVKEGAPITGVTKVNDKTVLISEFEAITEAILGIKSAGDVAGNIASSNKGDVRILLADDSSTLRKSLTRILNQYGYTNLIICNNGQQAWETLRKLALKDKKPADLVISDIEMPLMDGLKLTSFIKADPDLKDTPVVLFSSLVNRENIAIGKAAGADAQVSKPDSEEMIHAIENCLRQKGKIPQQLQEVAV